jgi:acyl carrier protein
MEKGSVEERVLNILCDILTLDFGETEKELQKRNLNIVTDLGAEDLDILEIVMALEDEFDVEIKDGDFGLEDLNTKPQADRVCRRFSEIVNLIRQKLLQKVSN